jgi:STE24 endopeptidase
MFNIIKWAQTLPNWVLISFVIFIVVFNIAISSIISNSILKYYRVTKSKEKALYRFKILSQYFQGFITVVSILCMELFLVPLLKQIFENTGIGIYVTILTPFPVLVILAILNQLIVYKTIKEIRETTDSRKEQLGSLMRVLAFAFIPMIIYFSIMFFLPRIFPKNTSFYNVLIVAIPILLVFLINIIMPFFYKNMLRANELTSGELSSELNMFLAKNGFNNIAIYEYPTKKSKVANALVSGFIAKKIFLSDYLIENASSKEIKAIIAHEMGHMKKNHLWLRLLSILTFMITVMGLGYGMEWIEMHFKIKIPEIPGIVFFAMIVILYFGFIYLYFTRIQERQADEYVLEVGIDPSVFISSLMRLARLNHTVMRFKKLDEKFQTHPSYTKRILWIERKAGIQYNILDFKPN